MKHLGCLSVWLFLLTGFNGCVLLVPLIESDQGRPEQHSRPEFISCSMNMAPNTDAINSGYCSGGNTNGLESRQNQRRESTTKRRVELLIRQLANSDAAIRTNAATDLGLLGPAAYQAVGPLSHAARYDESKWVRRAAVKSLPRISSDSRVVQVLAEAMHDSNRWVAHSAEGALRRIGTAEAKKALRQRKG